MKRFALLALAACVAALAAVAVASAAKGQDVNWRLQGAATWTPNTVPGIYNVQTFTVHGTVEGIGTYSGTLTAGTYSSTNECGPQCAPITGTITFETKRGTLTTTVDEGVVSVIVIGSGTYYSFTLTLSIDNGTKSYKHASGDLSLQYGSSLQNDGYFPCDPSPCTVQDGGDLTGMISR
jgi:hypothetical protein